MTDSSKNLEKKQSKPWYRHPSTLISLGAMSIALISAAIGAYQVNLARQQNTASEQQELVALVGDIAQDPANIAQQSLTFKNNTSAISQAQAGAEFTELADAEEAINIVGLLKGNGVTAAEYYEIALGLQPGESYGQALDFLGKAVKLPSDPRTHASILRLEAGIYYDLGRVSKAEREDMLAGQAFNHVPDVTKGDREANVAFTNLWDAYYQIPINCSRATADVSIAAKIMPKLLKEDPSAASDAMISAVASDAQELQHRGCGGKG